MSASPSTVIAGDDNAGIIFPTYLPEPERLVYEYVTEATQTRTVFPEAQGSLVLPRDFDVRPELDLFEDRDGEPIPVVRGWPTFPGQVPKIGVALGTETEDDQHQYLGGGFVGDAYARDADGNVIATASYFAEPLYAPVVVELIHENRDERDRLHNELRKVMKPLRRILTARSSLIKRVRVDAEKQELPLDEGPLTIYVSVFTVHVHYEMVQAVDVEGIGRTVQTIDQTVQATEIDLQEG